MNALSILAVALVPTVLWSGCLLPLAAVVTLLPASVALTVDLVHLVKAQERRVDQAVRLVLSTLVLLVVVTMLLVRWPVPGCV